MIGLASPVGLLGHFGQHALFRGFDHFEPVQTEGARGDHVKDQAVAVVARLDPVDLAFQRVLLGGDVFEILDAKGRASLVGGQRVFRAFKVGADHIDGFRIAVGGEVCLHRGHPVAKEHVDIAFGKAGVGDRNRQHLGFGFISQRLGDSEVAAVVAVMSVQPTSEKTILSQPSAKAEPAKAKATAVARSADFMDIKGSLFFVD